MEYDIFISYRRDGGSDFARKLQLALMQRKYNYNVFLDVDELKYGKFDHRILDAIDSAPIFMLVLSPHALDRCVNEDDWVRKEIEYAIRKKRHIIPINPDQLFDDFPAGFPEELKEGFGLHNFAEVMFAGQVFQPTVEQMVKNYIEPILRFVNRNPDLESQPQTGALYHVETDTECRILKFGEEIAVARPGEHRTIRLRKGRHKLEIVSTECPDDRLSITCTVEDTDMEDFIEIELLPVREKRLQIIREKQLQAEKEERERREAERKAEAETLKAKADKAYDAGNYTEAASLYRKAAEQGDAGAQYNLGWCYEHGQGVSRSHAEAENWYRKAADNGDEESKKILAEGMAFEIGDYYNKNGKEGVVFEVDATGRHGKIVSMKQVELQWCEKGVATGATDKTDGMKNMQAIRRIAGWREKYPAFAWCAGQGDGWYLPAIEELKKFTLDDSTHDSVNRTLSQHGGVALFNKGDINWYWSSSEDKDKEWCAWDVGMFNGGTFNNDKYYDFFVRAVSAF